MLRRSPLVIFLVLVVTAVAVTTSGLAAPQGDRHTNASRWLQVNASSHTVTLTLISAFNGVDTGYNFDGYAKGKLVVTVPVGWKVVVHCTNSTKAQVNHSCAIAKGTTSVLAFSHASSPNPVTGLAPGRSATFRFTPTRVGAYRISCLVPGHELLGMWDTFRVVAKGKPSLKL